MNFDTKYLIRWGIPGWIFILIMALYFFFFADGKTLAEFTNKNVFFVGVTFALIGVPLGYIFNQLHMYFDWVEREDWADFFKHEIKIDEYFVKGKGYPERYRYLIAKKHEVGSILVSFVLSTIIILFLNFSYEDYAGSKWLFLFVVFILSIIWWRLRCYSTKNAWTHYVHLRDLASPPTITTDEDMTENGLKYMKNLFNPSVIMKQYKDEKSLKKLSSDELKIMIQTTEYGIQQLLGQKSLFTASFSSLIALVIVLLTFNNEKKLTLLGVGGYGFILSVYYVVSNREINKLNAYLSLLRYVEANK